METESESRNFPKGNFGVAYTGRPEKPDVFAKKKRHVQAVSDGHLGAGSRAGVMEQG